MKISIIIPVYNAEKYLERCLESLRNQSFTDFEVILINDGSSDSSLSICKKYKAKDQRFILIDKKNEGVSKARNKGISESSGDCICFVDSDDYVDSDYLLQMYYDWNKSENTELVFQGVRRVFKNGTENTTHIPDIIVSALDKNKLFNVGKISLNGNPVSKLFKSSLVKDHNLFFNEKFTYNEDMIFILEYILLCRNQIVFSSTIHYNYMINTGSLTNKLLQPNAYFEPYVYYKRLFFEDFRINLSDLNFSIIYENFKINLHMFMNSALVNNIRPADIFDAEDWAIYNKISANGSVVRKFLDFFIKRKMNFIPATIIRLFLIFKF